MLFSTLSFITRSWIRLKTVSLAFSPASFTSWQTTELGNTSNYSSVRSGNCQKLQQASCTFLQWWSALGALGTKISREKCISLIQAVVHHLEPILFRAVFLGVLFWVYLRSIGCIITSQLSIVSTSFYSEFSFYLLWIILYHQKISLCSYSMLFFGSFVCWMHQS